MTRAFTSSMSAPAMMNDPLGAVAGGSLSLLKSGVKPDTVALSRLD